MVFRTTDAAQLLFRHSLEPFDVHPVEVRRHRKHFSMELFAVSFFGDRCYSAGRRKPVRVPR